MHTTSTLNIKEFSPLITGTDTCFFFVCMQSNRTAESTWSMKDLLPTAKRVCVATVASQPRIPNLHQLAATWGGWLSVAFLTQAFESDIKAGLNVIATKTGMLPQWSKRITLTLVEDVGYLRPLDRFPTNLLRNVASQNCPHSADAILMLDVDFVFCCGHPTSLTKVVEHYAAEIRRFGGNTSFVFPGQPPVYILLALSCANPNCTQRLHARCVCVCV